MKLDPLFKLENNKLFTIDGKNVIPNFVDITSIDSENNLLENSFFRLLINQSQIETEPECYNEEYLAKLRDFLKVMEEKNQFVILNIIPGLKESDIQKIASGNSYDDKVVTYIDSIKHATRRVKDCASVIGIDINEKFIEDDSVNKVFVLIDELLKKHGHYIYFIKNASFYDFSNLDSDFKNRIYFY